MVPEAPLVCQRLGDLAGAQPVSYTHLDVYKRQAIEAMTGCSVGTVNIHVGGVTLA